MRMLPRGKGSTVQPGRVGYIVAVSHADEVSSSLQTLARGSRLMSGMVAGVFLVGASVEGGAVEAKGHTVNLRHQNQRLLAFYLLMKTRLEKWWAATATFKAVHVGKKRRRHLWEKTTFLVRAATEDDARAKSLVIAKSKEYTYEAVVGDAIAWQFDEVVGLQELFDQELREGTEVAWSFYKRMDRSETKSSD